MTRRRLPSLSALPAFEAVVRLGSVTRAAEELGRTHGAISKQLKALQIEIGAPLFERSGTGLKANEAGLALAAAAKASLDRLAGVYEEVRREARPPSVHLACSASFAMAWLVPHLPRFSHAYPDIGIRLSMTSAREMREDREADLVILWDRSAYPLEDRRRAIRLGDCAFGVVAAPFYPVTIEAGRLVRADQRIVHDYTSRAWEQWSSIAGMRVSTRTSISFPHTHLCLGAAAAGMGIAIAERRLSFAEIASERLRAVTEFSAFPDGFAAIPHRSKTLTREAALLIDWLAGEMEA